MASHPVTLTRKELYDKVWSQPVQTLAQEYGISDVGLKKICKRRDIPTPGLGYWAKVAHGKTVRRTPLPPAKPEQSNVIVIHGSSEYGAPYLSKDTEADGSSAKANLSIASRPASRTSTDIHSCSPPRHTCGKKRATVGWWRLTVP